MEHLRKQIGITLYEFRCLECETFFWISHFNGQRMICPNCGRMVLLNGILPIKKVEFADEEEIKMVSKNHVKNKK